MTHMVWFSIAVFNQMTAEMLKTRSTQPFQRRSTVNLSAIRRAAVSLITYLKVTYTMRAGVSSPHLGGHAHLVRSGIFSKQLVTANHIHTWWYNMLPLIEHWRCYIWPLWDIVQSFDGRRHRLQSVVVTQSVDVKESSTYHFPIAEVLMPFTFKKWVNGWIQKRLRESLF